MTHKCYTWHILWIFVTNRVWIFSPEQIQGVPIFCTDYKLSKKKTYTRCLYFAQTINLVRKKHIQGVPNFCRNLKLSEGKHIVHCVVPILNQLTNILENYKGVLHYSVNFLNIHNGKSNKKGYRYSTIRWRR